MRSIFVHASLSFSRPASVMLLCLLISSSIFAQGQINTARPWTYWWWMGSAVDSVNLQRQLLGIANAGFGGVHIIPIYGVKGYETHFKSFLGTEWMSMLSYTTEQAQQLGLGVDLTMGTGWPFGGKHVAPKGAAKKFVITGTGIASAPTGQQVKRAAPGGEGPVIDYYDSAAVASYFKPFEMLESLQYQVRSLYHDSFEAYGANWSLHFSDQFRRRRGYAIEDQLQAFLDTLSSKAGTAVRMDYQQTLSELLHDRFTLQWTQWAKAHHYLTRNQAHGSPANILDLYALADIPETESFGASRFAIPGLRVDDHYDVERFGTPDVLAMKFASSAANLTGKKLVSSETGTWLADHFKVSLSQLKPQIDELFTAGINHVFYHGIAYSPAEEKFPGWLFYASTNFGLQSHLWKDLGLLNGWVTRCQERLQNSTPDNDILLYFPMHDIWAKTHAGDNPIQLLDVHHSEKWLRNTPFGRVAQKLMGAGHTFDYVSDSLLSKVVAKRGMAFSANKPYKVIVVPPVEFMPLNTLRRLSELSRSGVSVLYVDQMPKHPTGLRGSQKAFDAENRAGGNDGRVLSVSRLVQQVDRLGARKEGFSEAGLSFIRKRTPQGTLYFVANLSNGFSEGWVRVSENARNFDLYDPLTNDTRSLEVRRQSDGAMIRLELLPGQSAFVVPGKSAPETVNQGDWQQASLNGHWKFSFEQGVPSINHLTEMDSLSSWTALSDSAQYFYGAGRYQLDFIVKPDVASAREVVIDMGDVREVAEVRLNGQPLGTAWCIPFRLRVPASLIKEKNSLEIVVRNLSANYMRLYDSTHPEWKKFYDINIVDIQYRPYAAANAEPMPSGLTSAVRLFYR